MKYLLDSVAMKKIDEYYHLWKNLHTIKKTAEKKI